MANFEALGRRWDFYKSPEEIMQKQVKLQFAPFNAAARCYWIEESQFFPCFYHLGFASVSEALVTQKVNEAVDQAVEYFTAQWWTPDVVNKEAYVAAGITDPGTIELGMQECLRNIDKNRADRELKWFGAFTSAMFLCGLSGRWEDLNRICTWFDPAIEPEYTAGTLEDEYQMMFVYIGCSLNPDHQPQGREELLTKVKKCRVKRPRILAAIWEAIETHDQKGFDKAFLEGVNHFLSKPENTGLIYKWVDTHRSALLMLAEHRGLRCPVLSDKQLAAIVTPASAGMLG